MAKILLTGSNGLIGKKVKNFLKRKHQVRNIDLKNGIDLSSEIQVKKFFKKNKNFNYLINLHGANEHILKERYKSKNITSSNDEEIFDYYFKNNVFSIYLTNKYFIKYCKKGKGIINFSSIYSLISPKHKIYKEPKSSFKNGESSK